MCDASAAFFFMIGGWENEKLYTNIKIFTKM